MTPPYWQTSDVDLYRGDARTAWRDVPEATAHAIVTSPPYYGLRDYGVAGQLGLEESPGEYVSGLADLLTDWGTSVLRADGSLWLNLGDTYSTDSKWGGSTGGKYVKPLHGSAGMGRGKQRTGIPAKCLLMIPERVALALIDRGWILRNKVVWAKPNGMPSSAKDRLATKWEYVFHFTRQQRYWYDLDAIKTPAGDGVNPPAAVERKYRHVQTGGSGGINESGSNGSHANPGDVWTIPTQPYPDAHFAVFPPELVRRPILATVPEQSCKACGTGRQRIVKPGALVPSVDDPSYRGTSTTGQAGHRAGDNDAALRARDFTTGVRNAMPRRERTHVGWSDCGCDAGWTSGTVADPFAGAGTTAVMARRLGRRSILCELNGDYCDLITQRLGQDVLPFGGDL